MGYINKYKKFLCEQFEISKKEVNIKNDEDLIKKLEENYRELISSKEDLLIEKIKEKDKVIRNKPLDLENIYMSGIILIITVMLGFASDDITSSRVAYNILLFLVCLLIIGTSIVKAFEHVTLRYYNGYHNMCSMVLDKIESEYEEKIIESQKKAYEQKIDTMTKGINDIKNFKGIK